MSLLCIPQLNGVAGGRVLYKHYNTRVIREHSIV